MGTLDIDGTSDSAGIPKGKALLETVCLALTAAGAVAALMGSYIILPYRVAAVEQEQASAKTLKIADHDILVRIEEDVMIIQKALDKKGITP
jgi:predicted ATP-grasp superfamily ATP-dependent carboligase